MVEYVNSGIYFEATVGGFLSVALEVDNSYINSEQVSYTFRVKPENSYGMQGVLKVIFPDQI